MAKQATSYRLSEDAKALITRLKEKLGVSEADVIEMAVRRLARVELAEGRMPPADVLAAAVKLVEEAGGKRPARKPAAEG